MSASLLLDRAPSAACARVSDAKWHVLYVKSRQEKALCDDLESRRITHFLPLVRHPRFYGGRKKTVELPLFPSYVFLFGAVEDVYTADRTKRVTKVIHVSDQRQIEWELTNLKLALSAGARLRTHPFLSRGTKVEISAGPFKGLQGVVEDASRLDRLILQVQMLARAVSLEIDAGLVNIVRA